MHRKSRSLWLGLVLLLLPSNSVSAWFVLPPLVFDAQRFAQQVRKVQTELQWIQSLVRHLENDVRMLRKIEYSNLGEINDGLQRLESAVARVEALHREPQRVEELLREGWPIDWNGRPEEAQVYNSIRESWLAKERATIAALRDVQNSIVTDMSAARSRIELIVSRSNTAEGLTQALQAHTQLRGELSAELARLQMLRDVRAAARADRSGRQQSESARREAVAAWLMRDGTVQEPADGRGGHYVKPIQTAGGKR